MRACIPAVIPSILGLAACTQFQPELQPGGVVDFVSVVKPLQGARWPEKARLVPPQDWKHQRS